MRKCRWSLALRVVLLVFMDILLINLSSFVALWCRYDFTVSQIPTEFFEMALFQTVVTLLIFVLFRLYASLWTFLGVDELIHAGLACLAVMGMDAIMIFSEFIHYPRSYVLLQPIILFLLVMGTRCTYRYFRRFKQGWRRKNVRTMVIGAGEMGSMLLREFKENRRMPNRAVCLIDDNPMKRGRYLHGVRIAGGRKDIPACVEKYRVEEIIFAIPTADLVSRKEILEICQTTNCQLRIIHGIYQLTSGEVQVQKMRKVEIEDLLERESVPVNWNAITAYVHKKTVLVTGGGGSIGSELCRQIAKHEPEHLIIFDIYENNAYAIQQELVRQYPNLNLSVLIGSVRDEARVEDVFNKFDIDIVYHAAAHKHVPLMEDSPAEAVKNNIFGTRNVARAAGKHKVSSFVMISTDKAVNPTNVMGASKRVCEMVVQDEAKNYPDTVYAAVRFGNVLGSNGSVIPLFRKQIEAGGPVTVTHPDIIRYFMTIPEAVSLVLQAATLAEGGEIFVLDMGEPVKIDDLARKMIRLSGFTPDVDIKVEYTGLRPGEKLYEELLMAEEGLTKTSNNMIFIGHQMPVDEETLHRGLSNLCGLSEGEDDRVREILHELVPTFHTSEEDIRMKEAERQKAEEAVTV